MSEFNPIKLYVFTNDKINSKNSILPRRHTLTHFDKAGDLFLSIGLNYGYKRFSSLYSKLLRDEILRKWRESIFRQHMKIVLKTICYGDRYFLTENQNFLSAPIYVHFHTRQKT